MSIEIDEINYKDYISNVSYITEREVNINLLFITSDITIFKRSNYHSKTTIFDFKISDYLKMNMLTSYGEENPLCRSDKVYFLDINGELEYKGKKYKCIDNLIIAGEDSIPLYSFSNYVFNDVSIINTKKIDACAFSRSKFKSLYIDNNIEYIGFNALPNNLKIIDGYYDIKDNPKLILAKIEDVKKPIISNETRIIYHNAAEGLKGIEELIIPDGVVMIGCSAFYDCSNIWTISLPKTLKYIDERAFAETKAYEIYYDGTLEDWDKIIINDDDWSMQEWLDTPISLESSPRKKGTIFYVLDERGAKRYNGKRYLKIRK